MRASVPKVPSKSTVSKAVHQLFLAYPFCVQELAVSARQLLLTALPNAIEQPDVKAHLVGYSYGLGYKGVVATLILSKTGVKIGLPYGVTFPDPRALLRGAGKVHRHIDISTHEELQGVEVKQLIATALSTWHQRSNTPATIMPRKRLKPSNGSS